MRQFTLPRPSAALVVALVALVTAMSGSAVAASLFSGQQIKKRSIPADRVKSNALSGAQIDESRLGTVPLSQRALLADRATLAEQARSAERAVSADTAKTAETAKTADSAKTADDAKALNGRSHTAFLATGVRTVVAQVGPFPGPAGGYPATATASCGADEKAIGGGGGWVIPGTNDATALDAPVTNSMPTPSVGATSTVELTGWQVSGRNFSGTDRALRAYALCVPKVAPAS